MSVLGLELFTGRNISTMATPVWDKIGVIRDESLELSKALVDVTTRLAQGWRLQRGSLKEATINIQLLYDTSDADFIAIQQAFFNDTPLILGLFDGDITQAGTYQGLHAQMNVSQFSQPRNLEDAVVVDTQFVLDLETTTNEAPRWDTITTQ